jgi:hypothetical protein
MHLELWAHTMPLSAVQIAFDSTIAFAEANRCQDAEDGAIDCGLKDVGESYSRDPYVEIVRTQVRFLFCLLPFTLKPQSSIPRPPPQGP